MAWFPRIRALWPLSLATAGILLSLSVLAGECSAPGPIGITVAVDEGAVRYVNTAGIAEVTVMAGLPTTAGARRAQNALGLTNSAFEQRFVIEVGTTDLGDGWRCVWIKEVKAYIGFTKMDVFVAREYAPETCQHEAVLAHENEHVRRNRETLKRHVPVFEDALRQSSGAVGTMKTNSVQGAARLAADKIEAGLRPSFGLLEAALKDANTSYDTPGEYARLRKDCKTW